MNSPPKGAPTGSQQEAHGLALYVNYNAVYMNVPVIMFILNLSLVNRIISYRLMMMQQWAASKHTNKRYIMMKVHDHSLRTTL
jgi:hypothetical protein